MVESNKIEFIDRDVIPEAHPAARFASLWETLPRSGRFPDWKDFKPMSAPRILPWLILLETDRRNGEDVHLVRVQGSACVQVMGVSFQGGYIQDALDPTALRERQEEFRKLEEEGGMLFSRTNVPIKGREFQSLYRGAFMFSAGSMDPSRIVLVIAPEMTRII
jgi:hypothetical protein